MTLRTSNEVKVLKISIHGEQVGYLAGYTGGRNVLTIAEEYKKHRQRSTFGLITHPKFPNAEAVMAEPWARQQRLHPLLSNLLPEGSLRELLSQKLKVHVDNEFHLLSYLGADLPGAIVATPLTPDQVPDYVLKPYGRSTVIEFDQAESENKFSLAGVQMKFSMKEIDGRYNLSKGDALGDWIIKTPSTQHQFVPNNEFTAMSLARTAGLEIPEIKLIEIDKLDNLPPINLPNETQAFAIKRFDRKKQLRIHMEDFAQVFAVYPHEKYRAANYENIGRVIYNYSGDALTDIQQFARQILINILLANGDAHLKNWSLVYPDKKTPRLSPAYDIVTTAVYIENETQFALNLNKTKRWYDVTMTHFQSWSEKAGIPWRAIKPHLIDTLERARDTWPNTLKELPMHEEHKKKLQQHWGLLHSDFRIRC